MRLYITPKNLTDILSLAWVSAMGGEIVASPRAADVVWHGAPCTAHIVPHLRQLTNCVRGLETLTNRRNLARASARLPHVASFASQHQAAGHAYGADWVIKRGSAAHGGVTFGGWASPEDVVQKRIRGPTLRGAPGATRHDFVLGVYVLVLSLSLIHI